MGIEIERKFLLSNDSWRKRVITSTRISQGYLTQNAGKSSVRVRLSGDKANLNIKSRELAISRQEYEYPVPVEDAQKMLDTLCTGIIDKVRHHVEYQEHTWEIDEFKGDNSGLIIAEIELDSEDSKFPQPGWLGKEVSHDPRYYNVNLISHPYCRW